MGPKVLKLLQSIKAEKFEPSSPFQYNDERNNYVFPSKWFGQINNQGKRNTRPWLYSVKGMWATILKKFRHNLYTNVQLQTHLLNSCTI